MTKMTFGELDRIAAAALTKATGKEIQDPEELVEGALSLDLALNLAFDNDGNGEVFEYGPYLDAGFELGMKLCHEVMAHSPLIDVKAVRAHVKRLRELIESGHGRSERKRSSKTRKSTAA